MILAFLTIISFLVFAMLDELPRQDIGFELLTGDEVVILTGNFAFSSGSRRV
jgi:hypothetical protein